MIASEPIRIEAADGFSLAATVFRPPATRSIPGVVIVASAMGVRHPFYYPFAEHAASRGAAVVTFDYRGIGGSRPASLRGFRARLRDWGALDLASVVTWSGGAFPDRPVSVVAHSVGGQILGLAMGDGEVEAVLAVAAQSGYWRHWSGVERAAMWFLTHALLPSVSSLVGFFPMKLLGQGENLPGGVAIEWAGWCRNPRYAAGAVGPQGYERLAAPIRSYWVSDDRYTPRPAAEALFDLYPRAAAKELVAVDASRHGGAIGHFGFFRERFRDTLWRDAADWLSTAPARPCADPRRTDRAARGPGTAGRAASAPGCSAG